MIALDVNEKKGGTTMAKLRHLAILTHQPDKLADFYKRVFELQ